MVKQISDNEIYLLITYIKSVLWRVEKRLSYTEDARCLKVKGLTKHPYPFLPRHVLPFSCPHHELQQLKTNNEYVHSKELKFLHATETGLRSYPRNAHAVTAQSFKQSWPPQMLQCSARFLAGRIFRR